MAAAPTHNDDNTQGNFTLSRADILNPEDIQFIGHSGDEPPADDSEPEDSDTYASPSAPAADSTPTSRIVLNKPNELIASDVRIREKREDARGYLALTFTAATFLLFILGFLLAAVTDGDKVANMKEIFITISGIFSGLLGFVIGYYFRKGEGDAS